MSVRIGVEISSTAVRIAAVDGGGQRRRLIGWADEPLPLGAVVDGGVAEPAVVREALVEASKRANVARRPLGAPRRVRLSVSGLRAITRQLVMPPMPDGEIEAAARMQALEVVPFPPERTLLQARRLRGFSAAEGMNVLVEAAHRDLVEPVVTCVQEAGFVVEAVELASSALVRSLAGGGLAGPEAIVSIGAELTLLVVHEAGEVRFVRTIAAGGASVTRALASTLDAPFSDAEALKLRLGSSSAVLTTVPAETVAAARDASAALFNEIRSSILYYSSLPGAGEVRQVVLTGGGALLAGMGERLQFQMAAPVELRSCLDGMARVRVDADRASIGQRGAVVLGLALVPSGAKAAGLLPPEVLDLRRRHVAERAVLAGVGVVVLAAAAGGAARFVQVRRAEQAVSALQGSITSLQASLPRLAKAQQLEATAVADQRIVQPLLASEVSWPAVLADLGRLTPAGVATTSLNGASGTNAGATTASSSSSSSTPSGSLASSPGGAVLGTVSLSLASSSYPGFQSWFDALSASHVFQIVQYSGLTSSSSKVDFTAELNLTDQLRSKRSQRFEGFTP